MLLKGWLLLSTVLLPGCTSLLAPSRRRISTSLAALIGDAVERSIACINACANDRSAKPDDVVAAQRQAVKAFDNYFALAPADDVKAARAIVGPGGPGTRN